MKRAKKKPSDLKSKFTKKQKLIAGGVVLLVLVVTGVVWNSRATNTSAELSTSSSSSDSKKTSAATEDETSAPVEESASESSAQNSSSSPKESERQAPPPPTSAELCAKQTYVLASDGTLSCTYAINVTHVPARVVVYAVETAPTPIQLYEQVTYNVTCAKPAACSDNSWTTPGRAEFVVSEPTTVNVAVKQKSAYGSPTTNYTFQDWNLNEGGTNYGDGAYPYTLLGKFTGDR